MDLEWDWRGIRAALSGAKLHRFVATRGLNERKIFQHHYAKSSLRYVDGHACPTHEPCRCNSCTVISFVHQSLYSTRQGRLWIICGLTYTRSRWLWASIINSQDCDINVSELWTLCWNTCNDVWGGFRTIWEYDTDVAHLQDMWWWRLGALYDMWCDWKALNWETLIKQLETQCSIHLELDNYDLASCHWMTRTQCSPCTHANFRAYNVWGFIQTALLSCYGVADIGNALLQMYMRTLWQGPTTWLILEHLQTANAMI